MYVALSAPLVALVAAHVLVAVAILGTDKTATASANCL